MVPGEWFFDETDRRPLSAAMLELAQQAAQAQSRAYAPYSRFPVGAALLSADGRVFVGANIENASYGLTVCAERTAVCAAVLAGARCFSALAVYTNLSPPAAPCGLCRQTLAEFAEDLIILLLSESGEAQQTTLAALLPRAFRGSALLAEDGSPRKTHVSGK